MQILRRKNSALTVRPAAFLLALGAVAIRSVIVGNAVAAQPIALITKPALPCDMEAPCVVPQGRYMVKPPIAWDGKSPLAAVVWFHGYQQSSTDVMEDANLDQPFSDQNVLMVVPDGRDRNWSFPNGPSATTARDEIAFIADVVADVKKRYPIDPARLFAAGFSIGATMVWTQACVIPTRFSAYVAFSGDFWDPLPKSCADGPVRLLQIHGTADQTFPIHGRKLGGGRYTQGDAVKGLELWRQWKSCPPLVSKKSPVEGVTVVATEGCVDGSDFAFWQHTRAHEIDPVWVLAAIDWVKQEWAKPIR